MTDRPILFSGPMVRAILDGRKTQTRRLAQLKAGLTLDDIEWVPEPGSLARRGVFRRDQIADPTYAVGDRLWVREAWHAARSLDSTPPRDIPRDADIEHAATARNYAEIGLKGKPRPGMFLPRWASRITLIVEAVRVERLQDISEADAQAEGFSGRPYDSDDFSDEAPIMPYRQMFAHLWDSLNADRAPWLSNPWVVAVTFRPVLANIDQVAR